MNFLKTTFLKGSFTSILVGSFILMAKELYQLDKWVTIYISEANIHEAN
jgi:hypothetical protein